MPKKDQTKEEAITPIVRKYCPVIDEMVEAESEEERDDKVQKRIKALDK